MLAFFANCMHLYVCVHVCGCARAAAHLWRSESKQESVFYHVGPRDLTRVVRLSSNIPTELSHQWDSFFF